MKNIKNKLDKNFPKSCRKRKKDESCSDYLDDVYPLLKHILKSKRIAHREDEDLENFEERKMEREKVINEAMKENARLLSIGWENYVKNAIKKEGDWRILYNRTQLSEYYKWDSLPLCPYCGLETCGTLDHFLPKSKYLLLSTTLFNLIPCCFICNNKKSNIDPAKEHFYNPYLDEVSSDWLSIDRIELDNFTLQITYKINESINCEEKIKISNTCEKLCLLKRYSLRAVEFILNQRRNIKKMCASEEDVCRFFENMSLFLSDSEDEVWKKVLCEYIQRKESKDVRRGLMEYCGITNKWLSCNDVKNIVPFPGEKLDDYLIRVVKAYGDKDVYFISDKKYKHKIVCLACEANQIPLKNKESLRVFKCGVFDFSDCEDAVFYIFDSSKTCTVGCYRCIGHDCGVILLERADKTEHV